MEVYAEVLKFSRLKKITTTQQNQLSAKCQKVKLNWTSPSQLRPEDLDFYTFKSSSKRVEKDFLKHVLSGNIIYHTCLIRKIIVWLIPMIYIVSKIYHKRE